MMLGYGTIDFSDDGIFYVACWCRALCNILGGTRRRRRINQPRRLPPPPYCLRRLSQVTHEVVSDAQ